MWTTSIGYGLGELLIGRFHMPGLFLRGAWSVGRDENPRTRPPIKLAHSRCIETRGVFSLLVDHLATFCRHQFLCIRLLRLMSVSKRRGGEGSNAAPGARRAQASRATLLASATETSLTVSSPAMIAVTGLLASACLGGGSRLCHQRQGDSEHNSLPALRSRRNLDGHRSSSVWGQGELGCELAS